jgi:Tfp pilus assembly protein PilV
MEEVMGLGSRQRVRRVRWRGVRSEVGSSLVEALVATGVTAVGVLSVAVLFLYGTRLQTVSRDSSTAMGLATAQLEFLRMLPVADPLRSDVILHTENKGKFTVTWTIAPGPASTKNVTIKVSPTGGKPVTQLDGRLWR